MTDVAAAGRVTGRLAIRADRAFDGQMMTDGGALVLCADGKISGVEPAAAPVPDGWPVAEYPGATVLPGLIDCHVHLCGDSETGALDRLPGYSDEQVDAVIEAGLRAQLAAGVTTVRDLGDRRWVTLGWRDRIAAGTAGVPGPAIVAAGPPITTPAGHCWHMGGEAGGAGALRTAVREHAERGADIIKIMASGGVMTPGTEVLDCQYTLAELRAVADEAHASGLAVTAHAHGLPAVVQAIDAGVDGIEHCSCLAEHGIEVPDGLLERLAAAGIIVCPTLGRSLDVAPPPAVLAMLERLGLTWQDRLDLVGTMHRAGVRIASGVDSGISGGKPHGILARAIADLAGGGVSADDALASATSVAARACGLADRKGWLRPGYDADLAIVDGDPAADITELGSVRAVFVRGQAVGLAA